MRVSVNVPVVAGKDGGTAGWSPRRYGRRLLVMATVRMTLEIERDADPISGHVTGPQGQEREFCGWTALAATIDTALEMDIDRDPRGQEGERDETTESAGHDRNAVPGQPATQRKEPGVVRL
jgi:hypothetical protein